MLHVASTTPNVLHFGAALLITALLSALWPALWNAGLLLGLVGLGGVIYVFIVLWEVHHRLVNYQLVLSDRLWYMYWLLGSSVQKQALGD